MASKFSPTEIDAMNRDMRALAAVRALGIQGILDDLYTLISAGSIGITSLAADVDSFALGGGHFTQNLSTTAGLVFGYNAGRFHNGLATVSVAGSTITLAASQTNYVEVDRSGTVSSNTAGFTSGRLPLWTIVTGVSTIATVTISKPFLTLIGAAGTTGAMMSSNAVQRIFNKDLGASVAATTSWYIQSPNFPATLVGARFANSTAFATSNTDYWSWAIKNLGPSGAGTTDMLDTTAINSTQTTGGSLLTVGISRGLTLNGTGANLITAANDVIKVTLTKTGAPAALTLAEIALAFSFTG